MYGEADSMKTKIGEVFVYFFERGITNFAL